MAIFCGYLSLTWKLLAAPCFYTGNAPLISMSISAWLQYQQVPYQSGVYRLKPGSVADKRQELPAVVINEILFNPRTGGVDFVEIYNRSTMTVDLKDWLLANRNSSGAPASAKILSAQTHLLAPGEYRVITANATRIQEQYQVKYPATLLELAGLPAYANAGGSVVLMDPQNQIVDEVAYSEKWHFKLLNDLKGVSLERMDANRPSQDPDNWHSAASDVGYATPGYRNSQIYDTPGPSGDLTVDPRVFSPDNDGQDDYAIINYRFPEPGYVCNITIFNRMGVPVRYLTRNALCGKTGFFKWDGLNEKSSRLSMGTYIIFAEVFNLHGKTKRYKRVVTLAYRLR